MHAELVRRRAARLAAGETRHRIDNDIRSGRVVVPFRGTQVDAGIALDLSIRAAAAAATQHSDLAISHRTAAVLLQLPATPEPWSTTETPVEVSVPPKDKHRQRSGLHLRQAPLPPDQVRTVAGLRVTTEARTMVDLIRDECVGRSAGLALLEAALRHGRCTKRQLAEVVESLPGRRGIAAARELVDLGRPGVDSPGESYFRLSLLDAGLADDWLQVPLVIRDSDGLVLARADFGHEQLMVWGEYDGYDEHTKRPVFTKDRRGDRWLHDRGWHVMRFTLEDARRPELAARQYLRALQEAPERIMLPRQLVSPELRRAREWLAQHPDFVRDLRSLRLRPPRPAFAGSRRRSRA